jgi:hypothetical protein
VNPPHVRRGRTGKPEREQCAPEKRAAKIDNMQGYIESTPDITIVRSRVRLSRFVVGMGKEMLHKSEHEGSATQSKSHSQKIA